MESHLSNANLETAFWLQQFEEFNLNLESLTNLGFKTFLELQKRARSDEEVEALANFIENVKKISQKEEPNLTKEQSNDIQKSSMLIYTTEAVITYVKEWNMDDDLTLKDIEDRLEYILKVKRSVISSFDKTYWIKNYLCQTSLIEYIIMFVEKLKLKPKEKIQPITLIMCEILEKADLNNLIPTIPKCAIIFDLLYSCDKSLEITEALESVSDFNSFFQLLKKIEKNEESLAWKNELLCDKAIASIVSKGILKLQSVYQESYENLFIMILTHSFQIKYTTDDVKLKPLCLKDVQKIIEKFSTERQNFNSKKGNPEMMQVYLLTMAAGNLPLIECLVQMMKNIKPPVASSIQICIDKHLKGSSVTEFQMGLQLCEKKVVADHSVSAVHQQKLSHCKFKSNFGKNVSAHSVIHELELCKYYPKKMGLQDALCIKHEPLKCSLKKVGITDNKQLPSIILHKIMSYDCECRSVLLSENAGEETSENASAESVCKISGIHPMDCLLAIFICSDDFLCQDLFSRLAKCQFAIPFILHDPISGQLTIPLWAMRSIIKEWSISNDKGNTIQYSYPIVKHPMNIISFLRLGSKKDCKRSKSTIMNKIISKSHEHFFNYDLPGGHFERVLSDGLVNMTWYLPSGNISDLFSEPLAFLNLHGDARKYLAQATILSEVSSMCFIVVNESILELQDEMKYILKAMCKLPGGLTVLNAIHHKPQLLKEEIPNVKVVSLSSNAAQINNFLCEQIREKLKRGKNLKSIEELCNTSSSKFATDESNDMCQKGKHCAEKIKKMIQQNVGKMRDDVLPLQGRNWKDWASADKEVHRVTRRGKLSVNKYTEKVKKRKDDIRKEQLARLDCLNELMNSFILFLNEFKGSKNFMVRNYFLQFLKLELNFLSGQDISGKQCEYRLLRRKFLDLEQSCQSQSPSEQTQVSEHKKKLVALQKYIIESSFGLEHLLREVGQVYESAQLSDKYSKLYATLPNLAAELLIDGYPVELMDGDAAHVPIKWVMSVLEKASQLLKNPNMFVFSILGIQSTGKSTMLNTIFGVQFNVSSGRCTRGAFMQLLPLDEELQKKTKCKFVLIVDTEGLRAPELEFEKMQKHDNELATFVIGLANMTLINIYGEVTGDMNDILQTSVHAFLRMSKVKIYPSCKFVHQNAAANMTMNCEVGRAKLTEKLNQFTIAAAKEETKRNIKFFKDVITFNDQEDIHYFPGLWEGDPPMAPVNGGYSVAAQKLKDKMVSIVLQRGDKTSPISHENIAGRLSLLEFRARVNDLWQGLLKENFVFSFKNTLEISAYNALETAYNKWEWKFQEAMLQWEQKVENEITTEHFDSVSQKTNLKLANLQVYLQSKYDAIKNEMDLYFEQRGDIYVQWKVKFEKKLDTLKDELKKHAELHCRTLEESRKTISKFEKTYKSNAEMMTEKVQQHIERKRAEQESLKESLQQRKLKPEQLRYLFERKLLQGHKLFQYRDQKIITQEQVEQIDNVLKQHGGIWTEDCLKCILIGDILNLDQIHMIIKKTPQSESELQKKFNEIWSELIETIPSTNVCTVSHIKDDVESALISYVGSKGQSQLYSMLSNKPLPDWNDSKDSEMRNPSKSKNFLSAIKNSITSLIWQSPSSQPDTQPAYYSSEVIHATEDLKRKVLEKVHKTLQELLRKNTDFNPSYTGKVLQSVDQVFESCSKRIFHLLPEGFQYELYLTACSKALIKFERMAKLFQERNDPRLNLEKRLKGPLLAKFKNQYKQTEAEEGIADTLCAYLEEPIKVQVSKVLSVQMVTQMKDSDHSFASKTALKIKVLRDLHQESNFQSYIFYLRDIRRYLEKKIKHYTINFCDTLLVEGRNTRLQSAAKDEVSRLIRKIKQITISLEVNHIKKWLGVFSDNVRADIGDTIIPENVLAGYDSLENVNLDNLKKNIEIGLDSLRIKLHKSFSKIRCETEMVRWKIKPHELLDKLIGCTAQCPFCGEQCDLLDPNHESDCDHRVEVHRIHCLAGYRWLKTQEMTTHFCQAVVCQSDVSFKHGEDFIPFNEYKTIHKKWEISPDPSSEASLYWKWFVGKYYREIAEEFGAKSPDVPQEWFNIQWNSVERNLNELYNF